MDRILEILEASLPNFVEVLGDYLGFPFKSKVSFRQEDYSEHSIYPLDQEYRLNLLSWIAEAFSSQGFRTEVRPSSLRSNSLLVQNYKRASDGLYVFSVSNLSEGTVSISGPSYGIKAKISLVTPFFSRGGRLGRGFFLDQGGHLVGVSGEALPEGFEAFPISLDQIRADLFGLSQKLQDPDPDLKTPEGLFLGFKRIVEDSGLRLYRWNRVLSNFLVLLDLQDQTYLYPAGVPMTVGLVLELGLL